MGTGTLDTVTLGARAMLAAARAGVFNRSRPTHLPSLVRAYRTWGSSLATLAAITAIRHPHRPAVIDERGTLSYAELDRNVGAIAAGMHDHAGVVPGHGVVAVLCRNHRGFLEASLAASRLGADLVLLNTEFSAPQLTQALRLQQPSLVVLDEEFLPVLAASGSAAPRLLAWQDTEGDLDESELSLDMVTRTSGTVRPPRAPRPGKITILTSGTTGAPKGAPRRPSTSAMLGPVQTMLSRTRLSSGDPIMVCPPLFHGFGLVVWALAIFLGSPLLLRRKFDAAAALASIHEHRAKFVAAVPVMLQRMLDCPDRTEYDVSSLHTVLCGAAPLSPALATRALDEWGDVLFNGYGSSEGGIISLATPADLRARPDTVGRPTSGSEVRILDERNLPVGTGVPGRVFVGGGLVFRGYTGGGNKETVGGLLGTGDLGHLDEDGRLYVDGRADDMIVSGGENVYPQEVENTLAAHDGVAEVVVLGVPDEEFGQRLVAYVVRAEGSAVTEADLKSHVRASLARYKVPRAVLFIEELPRTATGKVVRGKLAPPGG
jgi:acyl-CoA synthetase (AMP-forming)/AMP-acid ligase II